MPEPNLSNIGADLLYIHSIITRALSVATETSRSFAHQEYPSEEMQQGFICYVQSLISVLAAHHHGEDEVVFPMLRDRLPDAPYDLLISHHRTMESMLLVVEATVEEMPQARGDGFWRTLAQKLTAIADLWQPHIRIEEDIFTVEKLGQLMSPEEHGRLSRLFVEYNRQHTSPDYLIVPFLLFNLMPEERAIMAQTMPPDVTQQLVPVIWKDRWAPMQPFLLA